MSFTEKHLRVLPALVAGDRHVKRYEVNLDPAGVDPAVAEAAYALLPQLLPESDGETPPITFTVLHQTSQGCYLNAYSWVWGNVLHFAGAAAAQPVLGCPDDDPTHFVTVRQPWIGCVWELPPLEHERSAWVRHVLAPDRPDPAGYLGDTLAPGPVGL
jgi:hypothetical protein